MFSLFVTKEAEERLKGRDNKFEAPFPLSLHFKFFLEIILHESHKDSKDSKDRGAKTEELYDSTRDSSRNSQERISRLDMHLCLQVMNVKQQLSFYCLYCLYRLMNLSIV